MHVCTSQLVLPIVFIVHLFNIVFYYFFYYPYGLLSEIKYYYYYYYQNSELRILFNIIHEDCNKLVIVTIIKITVIKGKKNMKQNT